jgi:NADH:ubiquinone oxidoreductase subunit E
MPSETSQGAGKLESPQVRAELLAHLEAMQDESGWLEVPKIRTAMRFFFEDHDFAPHALRQVGLCLTSMAEAAAIQNVVSSFEAALGPRSKKISRITGEEWRPVAAASSKALQLLSQAG